MLYPVFGCHFDYRYCKQWAGCILPCSPLCQQASGHESLDPP
ncbi:hypothetical protein BURPS1655_K0562 [Burkholderia pseudomallei 1655]|nr:hypothetical protein BURPS1655_K0562 [Burkholderia pseudomallei 1655]